MTQSKGADSAGSVQTVYMPGMTAHCLASMLPIQEI